MGLFKTLGKALGIGKGNTGGGLLGMAGGPFGFGSGGPFGKNGLFQSPNSPIGGIFGGGGPLGGLFGGGQQQQPQMGQMQMGGMNPYQQQMGGMGQMGMNPYQQMNPYRMGPAYGMSSFMPPQGYQMQGGMWPGQATSAMGGMVGAQPQGPYYGGSTAGDPRYAAMAQRATQVPIGQQPVQIQGNVGGSGPGGTLDFSQSQRRTPGT